MAFICSPLSFVSTSPSRSTAKSAASTSQNSAASSSPRCQCFLIPPPSFVNRRTVALRLNYINSSRKAQRQVVRMAPDEERLTRRNPLDFPIEWERPKPGRRPDIFPQFSPMKTPLPPPLPYDPPEEDEEEEEKKEEEEEDPDGEEGDKPES